MGVTFALLLSLTGAGALMTFLFSAIRRRRLEGSETALAVGIAIVVLGLSFWSGRQLWSTPGPAVALRLVQMDLPVVDGLDTSRLSHSTRRNGKMDEDALGGSAKGSDACCIDARRHSVG